MSYTQSEVKMKGVLGMSFTQFGSCSTEQVNHVICVHRRHLARMISSVKNMIFFQYKIQGSLEFAPKEHAGMRSSKHLQAGQFFFDLEELLICS